MGVVCALNNDLRGLFPAEGINAIHHMRAVWLQRALFSCQYAIDIDTPGAQQLGQVQGQLCRCAPVFQSQPVGGLTIGSAKMVGEVGVLPDVYVLRCLPAGKLLRPQQLAGIIFPSVHQKGRLLRVVLKHVVAQPARERGSIFIVKLKQSIKCRRSHQNQNSQEQQTLSAFF